MRYLCHVSPSASHDTASAAQGPLPCEIYVDLDASEGVSPTYTQGSRHVCPPDRPSWVTTLHWCSPMLSLLLFLAAQDIVSHTHSHSEHVDAQLGVRTASRLPAGWSHLNFNRVDGSDLVATSQSSPRSSCVTASSIHSLTLSHCCCYLSRRASFYTHNCRTCSCLSIGRSHHTHHLVGVLTP